MSSIGFAGMSEQKNKKGYIRDEFNRRYFVINGQVEGYLKVYYKNKLCSKVHMINSKGYGIYKDEYSIYLIIDNEVKKEIVFKDMNN
jgi:hypothetical protein